MKLLQVILIFSLFIGSSLIFSAERYNSVFEPGQEITIRNESGRDCKFFLRAICTNNKILNIQIASIADNMSKVINLSTLNFDWLFELRNAKISAFTVGNTFMVDLQPLAIGGKYVLHVKRCGPSFRSFYFEKM